MFAFSQADVRGFATAHQAVLAEMAEFGFRFALDEVTDLDMDFEALKKAGFEFVKLDAAVFLGGLPAPGGHVPAADLCRHLAGEGLTLIVGAIGDERELARIHGFGVLLGQGTLFGAPRPVKADVLRDGGAAAA
jgi:cyclic-di-GMP phosphodiesterase TipF (flagellum assembly factor)